MTNVSTNTNNTTNNNIMGELTMTNLTTGTINKGLSNTMKEELTMTKLTNLEVAIQKALLNNVTPTAITGAKNVLRRIESKAFNIDAADNAIQMLEAGLNPYTVIETAKQLKPLLKSIKHKDYVSVLDVTQKTNKYGQAEGRVSSISQSVGRAFDGTELEKSILVPTGINAYKTITKNGFAPFTKDIIAVKFESESELKKSKDFGIYVLYAGRNTAAYTFTGRNGLWSNVVNGRTITIEELQSHANDVNGDLRLHKCFVFSPSDIRNLSYAAMDVTNGDNRNEALDKMSNGAWSIAKTLVEDMISGKELKKDGSRYTEADIELYILKTMPRFGQFKAGSANLGKIPCWAYYQENFKTSDGETLDGTSIILDEYVAECFSRILGVTVLPKAVRGMFLQTRPDAQKAGTLVVSRSVMARMYKNLKMMGEMKTYGAGNNEMFKDEDNVLPVLLVDKNIVKAESNYAETGIYFELLEIATCSSANSSMQMLMKGLYADQEKAMNWINSKGIEATNEKVANTFLVEKASIPTPGQVAKCYASELIIAMDPKRILQDCALHKNALTSFVNSDVNAANKLKYAIDGNNVRLTSDPSEILAGRLERQYSVIPYGRIYMPAASKFFMKKAKEEVLATIDTKSITKEELKAAIVAKYNSLDKRVCMIKYPSMGVKEFYVAEIMGYNEVCAIVNAMDIDAETKTDIKDYYRGIGETVAILPAVKIVMFQCAGLDYDYDGATFVYDNEFVQIVANSQTEATKYVNSQE